MPEACCGQGQERTLFSMRYQSKEITLQEIMKIIPFHYTLSITQRKERLEEALRVDIDLNTHLARHLDLRKPAINQLLDIHLAVGINQQAIAVAPA